jgi:hypothetical protein
VRQLVPDETAGYIIREPTEESLAPVLDKAYARVGTRVPETYSAELSWDRIADQFIALYEDALTEHVSS